MNSERCFIIFQKYSSFIKIWSWILAIASRFLVCLRIWKIGSWIFEDWFEISEKYWWFLKFLHEFQRISWFFEKKHDFKFVWILIYFRFQFLFSFQIYFQIWTFLQILNLLRYQTLYRFDTQWSKATQKKHNRKTKA
jgi:hypothetical protein